MRAVTIDWLIEVHSQFNMKEETLFICINLIDRYLNQVIIQRSKLQLLSVTSLLIACKQEEIYVPCIADFVYITDYAYTKEQIYSMENEILRKLKFEIVVPSSLRIFEIISNNFKFNEKQNCFGWYLMEIFLIDFRMKKYLPSVIACTSAYLVMKFFKLCNYNEIYTVWNKNNQSTSTIKECAREICFLVDNIGKSSLKAAKRKFSRDEYLKVALIAFS